MSIFFLIHMGLTLYIAYRVISRKLTLSTSIVWIMFSAFLPIGGAALYYIFGDHRMGRKRVKQSEDIRTTYQDIFDVESDAKPSEELTSSKFYLGLSDAILNSTDFPVSGGNSLDLMRRSELILHQMTADFDNAKDFILLEFYIIDPQGRTRPVLKALERAARRGVDVRLLADDYGSRPFWKSEWPQRLRNAGAVVIKSLPVNFIKSVSKRSDLRNHRKLVIVDGIVGYVGSFNLIDPKCFKSDKGVGEWVDIMARVKGPILKSLAAMFHTDFIFDHPEFSPDKDIDHVVPKRGVSPSRTGHLDVQLLPSGPEMRASVIYETLLSSIFSAEDTIDISTPYFVPDEAITLALCNAARRGVKVRLITPKNIDSFLARYASQSNYYELLKSGVKIYKFNEGLLHTKAVLVDGQLSLFGTANFDMRSFYLNLEMTLVIYDRNFTAQLTEVLEDYISRSIPLKMRRWKRRGSIRRFTENLCRLASPVL